MSRASRASSMADARLVALFFAFSHLIAESIGPPSTGRLGCRLPSLQPNRCLLGHLPGRWPGRYLPSRQPRACCEIASVRIFPVRISTQMRFRLRTGCKRRHKRDFAESELGILPGKSNPCRGFRSERRHESGFRTKRLHGSGFAKRDLRFFQGNQIYVEVSGQNVDTNRISRKMTCCFAGEIQSV